MTHHEGQAAEHSQSDLLQACRLHNLFTRQGVGDVEHVHVGGLHTALLCKLCTPDVQAQVLQGRDLPDVTKGLWLQ